MRVKGQTTGIITDIDGRFKLSVPVDASLLVSYIGYLPAEVDVKGKTSLSIVLQENTRMLDDVVVTALGIKREKKALGYAMQEIKTDDFSENRSTSVSNLLQGKVAGVQISQSGSGVGGDTRVILRGLNSLSGNNAPLWVVDGLPILSDVNGTTQFSYSSGAADINPDDIESVSVLKGANAAALYGSRAQSGAIIITTKKGKAGKIHFDYNGYVSFSKPYDSYKLQDVYGQGTKGEFSITAPGSWGPRMEGQMIPNWRNELYGDDSYGDYAMWPQKDIIKDFFRTALNYTNSISASGGNDNINARFSFTDSRNQGILPNESLNKQSYNLNVEMKNKYLTIGAKVAYFREKNKNRSNTFNGVWQNLLTIPRSIRLQDLQNPLGKEGYVVNWSGDSDSKRNPYQYVMDGNGNQLERDRFQGQLTVTGNICSFLKVTGRVGMDRIADNREIYQTYYGKAENNLNLISIDNAVREELNADLMLNFNKTFKQFTVTANVGVASYYKKYKSLNGESGMAILPGFTALSNGDKKLATQGFSSKRINSVLGNATIGYKGFAFLDLTARNDWSSTLPANNRSYFYPSVSLSGILSDIFKLPSSYFLKVRGSIAQVGNDTDPYALDNVYTLTTLGTHTTGSLSTTYPLADLKPENTVSWELGFDYRMFNNRLGIDFTYYYSTTTDQILSMTIPSSSGYKSKRINAGKMESKGVELMVNATPLVSKDWKWDITLNWGKNVTKNVHLDEKTKRYIFPMTTNIRIGKVVVDEGGKFGDIVSTAYQRDDAGNILVDDKGLPLIDTKSEKVIGNMLPKWTGSFGTTLTWRNISLNALVDVRYGGQFLSLTDALASGVGNSKKTLEGRDGMVVDGIVKSTGHKNDKVVTAQEYWSTIAGSYPVGEDFLYDATYVKLREISIGYVLPQSWFRKMPISNVKVSFVGRDLFNIYKAAPVNAEYASQSSDVYQAFELAALPSTRTFGFSLNVKF